MAAGVRISIDGRGRRMDNVFIERLWRSLKHEDIYLKGYADGHEATRRHCRIMPTAGSSPSLW
jgi:putative transposase